MPTLIVVPAPLPEVTGTPVPNSAGATRARLGHCGKCLAQSGGPRPAAGAELGDSVLSTHFHGAATGAVHQQRGQNGRVYQWMESRNHCLNSVRHFYRPGRLSAVADLLPASRRLIFLNTAWIDCPDRLLRAF